jgi:VWFA-related protein
MGSIRIYNELVRMLRGLCVVLAVCWGAALVQAGQTSRQPSQAPPAPAAGQVPIFRGGVTVVTAQVTVTNEGGEFVTDLKPQEFRVYDNDTAQDFTVEFSENPLAVVIVLGNSSRLGDQIKEMQKLGVLFTSLVVGERGEAAVLVFDHEIHTVQPFTSDPDKVEKAFKDLKEGSSQSRLNDALVMALTMLRDRPPLRRKVIIAVSEGHDFGSQAETGYVLREAQIGGIPIYSVNLSKTRGELTRQAPPPRPSPYPPGAGRTYPGVPPTPTAEMQTSGTMDIGALLIDLVRGAKDIIIRNPMEAYAKGTGATDIHGFKFKAIEEAVNRIGSELHNQYVVTYRPNNLDQLGFHTIRVIVDRPKVKAVTRPGYFLAGPVAAAPLPQQPSSSEARR